MLSQKLRECGVVGAGGAGFPTCVKAQSQVEFVIANGAECTPEHTAVVRFPLTYRGRILEVEIANESVEYTLRRGEDLVIHHDAEEVHLTRDQPKAIRAVGRW